MTICTPSLCPTTSYASQIMDIMAVKDRDGSGGLCFAEFLALMASEMRDMSGEDEVKDAFERACGDDGLLGEQELLQMAADMKVQLIPSQARAMLAEAARDSSDPGAADTASTAPRISQQDAVKLMQGQ